MSALVEASDPQKIERDRLSYQAWGGQLTEAQYLDREQTLRAHPWARRSMRSWLWVDEGGRALASCETFASRSWLRGAEARSYAVASVFTEPALRGRGHATAMMDALAARLRSDDPGAHAVTLYSDVGAALYARSGYAASPAFDGEMEPEPGDPASPVDALLDPPEAPAPPAAEPFVIWPDDEQLGWHLARERFYASALGRPGPPCHGARAGDARALWVGNLKSNRLLVLLVAGADAASLGALLAAARRAAHAAGLERVTLWEDEATRALLPGVAGLRRVERDGSLPMLRPLAPGLDPSLWRLRPRALWV